MPVMELNLKPKFTHQVEEGDGAGGRGLVDFVSGKLLSLAFNDALRERVQDLQALVVVVLQVALKFVTMFAHNCGCSRLLPNYLPYIVSQQWLKFTVCWCILLSFEKFFFVIFFSKNSQFDTFLRYRSFYKTKSKRTCLKCQTKIKAISFNLASSKRKEATKGLRKYNSMLVRGLSKNT